MQLEDSLESVKGVGAATAKALATLGLRTIADVLDYLPRRYEDYSVVSLIANLQPGPVTIEAELQSVKGRYVRRGLHITEALVRDSSGSLRVTWFNQPYRAQAMKSGETYFFSGQFELSYQRMQLMNPSAELKKDFTLNTARIVPVYRENKHFTSKQIRKVIGQCLPLAASLPETLPSWLVADEGLLARSDAIRAMHYPRSSEELSEAKRRLGFEEVFELSLASLLNKQANTAERALVVRFDEAVAKRFVASLPFRLTDDQRKTVWQIYRDMEYNYPMNRLVEGDVGSGKTVVAAMAAVMAIRAGFQVALMAPTEILARQHYASLLPIFQAIGEKAGIRLIIGGLKKAEKLAVQNDIADGTATFIIGTHALIQEKVAMERLGLVIVDEQHRFGVEQRKALMSKAGTMPHVLSLTATPIPRSLALTLYGELDVSILREKPVGRKPIETDIILHGDRDSTYKTLANAVREGEQLYVVCPLITESESLDAKSAETLYKELSATYFKDIPVGLLHGKMKSDEKQAVMQQFSDGSLRVLVATTVIEVGVDVPNATRMVIESAERFGLAQLHQLRGRVGRSDKQSYCLLMLSAEQQPTRRLRAIKTSNDGFQLAEFDLELRGAGAIYGAMQHGALDLRVAKLTDTELIMRARSAAKRFIDMHEKLVQYTELHKKVSRLRTVTNLN